MLIISDDMDLITSNLRYLKLNEDYNDYVDPVFNFGNLPILDNIYQYLTQSEVWKMGLVCKSWYFKSFRFRYRTIGPLYYPPASMEFKKERRTQTSQDDWDSYLLDSCIKGLGKNISFVNTISLEKLSSVAIHLKLFSHFQTIQTLEFFDHLVNMENLVIILDKLINLKHLIFKCTGFHNVQYLTTLGSKPKLPECLKGMEFIKSSKLTETSPELMQYLSTHKYLTSLSAPYQQLLEPIEEKYVSLLHLNITALKTLNPDYLKDILSQNLQLKSLVLHSKIVSKRIIETINCSLMLETLEINGDPLQNIPNLIEIHQCFTLRKFHLKVATTHANIKHLLRFYPNLIELTIHDHIFPSSLSELVETSPLLKRLNLSKYRLEGIEFNQLHRFNHLYVVHLDSIAPWNWQKYLQKVEEKYDQWKFKPKFNGLILYSKIKN